MRLLVAILFACALVVVPVPGASAVSGAAPRAGGGSLDPSFGSGGKVVTDWSGSVAEAAGVAIQRDGKIVVAGSTGPSIYGGGSRFALARYNVDGSLDTTFGSGGKVLTGLGGDFYGDEARAVAIQQNGKIVVGGVSYRNSSDDFALVRYNPDGSLDQGFGVGGKVVTDVETGSEDAINALAIDHKGRIVAAGYFVRSGSIPWPTPPEPEFALARFDADGSLDTSFGTAGHVITNVVDQGTAGGISAVAIQPNGRIVAAGIAGLFGAYDFAIARYEDDGSLDAGFGNAGTVLTDFGGSFDEAHALDLQPNGEIVVAGESNAGGSIHFALARYERDGSLDARFGTGGKVATDFGDGGFAAAEAVAVERDGRIVVAGPSPFKLARYERDGSLDPSFGSGGLVTTTFIGEEGASGLALQRDGRIVVAGVTAPTFHAYDFAVARYNP